MRPETCYIDVLEPSPRQLHRANVDDLLLIVGPILEIQVLELLKFLGSQELTPLDWANF